MANNVTVTGKTGPADAVTSQLFSNVTELNINYSSRVLFLTYDGGKRAQIDIDAATTVTYTIASKQATVTIS